ncbi:MAG: hypothetical protein ACK41T_10290, partial [Pseudobdellovibrio sp.]
SQIPAYKNSQLGSIIGGGLNDGSGKYGSNVKSQNQNSMSLNVSQLYLNVNHEYGAFLVGRAPIEFGMGITHNAGLGAFDHWADTKEVISYRFTVDNLSFAPMLARVSQEDFGGGVSNEKIFMVDYNNKDAGARAGVFHQTRTGGPSYNDILLTPGTELPKGATRVGGYKTQTINIFLERKWQPFEFKVEASFETGSTGVQTGAGEEINLDAYAVVAEALWPARDSKWQFNTRFGVVSGDNPDSANYEGYQLDKNYDVAMLMFNHRMGKADILGTSVIHANDSASGLSTQNSADDEAVSNVMFIAPSTTYTYNDKVDMKTSLVYGQLMTNTNNFVDFKKDLGLELDMELVYKPRERVTWSTGVGVLFPGAAWKAGNLNLDNKTNFGLSTKAAITF